MAKYNQRLQGVPMYERIAQDIREKILSGQWGIHSALPSRPKLASEYQVAPLTIERAIAILLEEGVLHSINGRGTFVHALPEIVEASPTSAQALALREPTVPLVQMKSGQHTGRQVPTRPLTLALVDGDMPASHMFVSHPDPENGQDWMTLILTSLQRAISQVGGRSISVQRFEGIDAHARYSLAEALLLAVEQGATMISISNILDIQKVTSIVLSTIDISRIPVVFFSWEPIITPLPYVTFDHAYEGYQAAQHMFNEGYETLYYLDVTEYWWSKERLRGVQAALRDAGSSAFTLSALDLENVTPEEEAEAFQADPTNPDPKGYIIGKRFFAQTQKGTQAGFIAPNDWIAFGWLTAAQEAGWNVGEDFGLVGFDNVPRADRVGLTTLAPPLEEMGQEAARLLLALAQGQPTSYHSSLRSHLFIRTSTRRIHPRVTL